MFSANAFDATSGSAISSTGNPTNPLFAQDIPIALNALAEALSPAARRDQ